MADRFPSIEDLDAGKPTHLTSSRQNTLTSSGQPGGLDGNSDLINNSTDNNDFLARERALLGNDADQFSTPQDNAGRVTVEEDDDDLLGGGGGNYSSGGGNADMGDFESSFPAIDNSNDVSINHTTENEVPD
jgi:hypothetical protein